MSAPVNLRALAEAATAAREGKPWTLTNGPDRAHGDMLLEMDAGDDWFVVAEFMVSASPRTILALLTDNERLQGEVERLREALAPFAAVSWPDSFADSDPGNTSLVTVAEYRAARRAFEDSRGGGWRPIDTAPKDRSFQVWQPHRAEPDRIMVAYRHNPSSRTDDIISLPGLWNLKSCTHWRELPAPPASDGVA